MGPHPLPRCAAERELFQIDPEDGRSGSSNISRIPTEMPAGWPRRLAVATITIGLMMSVFSNSMTNPGACPISPRT